MKKKIKGRLFVSINGKYELVSNLPEDQKKKILSELNDRAMRAAGYVPITEVQPPQDTTTTELSNVINGNCKVRTRM